MIWMLSASNRCRCVNRCSVSGLAALTRRLDRT
jgi:hypothetical protein